MEQQLKLLRVFIASPSDLGDERRILWEVVDRINAIFSKETEWRIELLGWEDTLPGTGRPQELINADLDKADLFIGCLWQRWGSVSGSEGKTGFEEEFDRAVDRKTKSDSPEVWLFFKDVDVVTRSDPGPQLQKVLAFRSRQIEAKRLFFKEFADASIWREMIFELLHRHMLRLVTAPLATAKEVQSTGNPQSDALTNKDAKESAKSEPKHSSAFSSLAAILKHAEQMVNATKLPAFDRSETLSALETVRMLLFATTNYDWNGQHVQLGTHEINSVYFHRTALDPTSLERFFLLRTILLDESLTKPGWFWLRDWKMEIDLWLAWFALHDSEKEMRVQAVDLATRIGFSLCKRKKKLEPSIFRLLSDEQVTVRLAALRHLAALGRESDLPLIARLLEDDSKDVRTQAERTGRMVRLKVDPDGEMRKSIEQRDPFDEGIADAVAQTVDKISSPTLVMALGHPSGALKAIASKELLKRGVVSTELAGVMCRSDAKAVRESGFIAQVGHSQSIDSSQIRSALIEPFPSYSSDVPLWNKANPDSVVSAYLDRLAEDELWKQVYSFNEDSHLALRSIGRRFIAQSIGRVRHGLGDDFQKHVEAAKIPRAPSGQHAWSLLSFLSDPNATIESERKRVRIAALDILANNHEPSDREVFLKFLSADPGEFLQTVACLRGLSNTGRADDRDKLTPLLSHAVPFIQAAAARAYLALSPSSVAGAKDLLSEPSEYRVWIVIRYALKSGERTLWPILKPLLGHENENIRRLVCYHAVRVLNRAATEKLLNEYHGRGRYFYNVVTLIDRSLYAPKILRDSFIKEEQVFFDKWLPSATWQWNEESVGDPFNAAAI